MNQPVHINKYVQSHIIIIIFNKHVSITPVPIMRVSYSNNTTNIHTDNCTKGYDKAT